MDLLQANRQGARGVELASRTGTSRFGRQRHQSPCFADGPASCVCFTTEFVLAGRAVSTKYLEVLVNLCRGRIV